MSDDPQQSDSPPQPQGTTAANLITQVAQSRAQFEQLYFSDTATIDDIFGHTEGSVRQKAMFDVYLVATMAIPWFTPDGRRCIERHDINQRKNDAVRASYVNSIASSGLCEGVRGEP